MKLFRIFNVYFNICLFSRCKWSMCGYLKESFEVWLLVGSLLQQRGTIQLAAAEADVGLHVWQLRGQDVPDHMNRHFVSSGIFPCLQGPANTHIMHDTLAHWKKKKYFEVNLTYLCILELHWISSLQLTNIMFISASVRRPDSDMGL